MAKPIVAARVAFSTVPAKKARVSTTSMVRRAPRMSNI